TAAGASLHLFTLLQGWNPSRKAQSSAGDQMSALTRVLAPSDRKSVGGAITCWNIQVKAIAKLLSDAFTVTGSSQGCSCEPRPDDRINHRLGRTGRSSSPRRPC